MEIKKKTQTTFDYVFLEEIVIMMCFELKILYYCLRFRFYMTWRVK